MVQGINPAASLTVHSHIATGLATLPRYILQAIRISLLLLKALSCCSLSMAETISSLYGPGAFICWLCTAISVLLSWYFNLSSQKYDTITNDFAGCLLFPAIATTHLVYELTRTNNGSKATLSMEATFTVCMFFQPIGISLCAHALSNCQKKMFVLTAAVTVPCLVMVIVVFATSGSKMHDFNFDNVLLPFLLSCTTLLLWAAKRVPETSTKFVNDRQAALVILPIVTILQYMVLLLCFYSRRSDNSEHSLRVLPQIPYSFSDFDQVVALSIGIITLLLSIGDIVLDSNFSAGYGFEYWRVRCVQNIEYGDTDVEITRWTQELESIEKKAKLARTRAKHGKREQTTYEELPIYMKIALQGYIQRRKECNTARLLREAGFLP